jgi:hypothetical protein
MVLLMIAGAQKLIDPSSTSGALRAAGLPGAYIVVRGLGLAEIVVAGAFLIFGGELSAWGGALFYGGFAGFVGYALVRDLPLQSCGCLGSVETPPTRVHFVMNLIAMAVMVMAAIIPIGPLGGLVGQEVRTVIPFVLFTGVVVYLLYALLTVLPMVSKRAMSQLPTPLGVPTRRAG